MSGIEVETIEREEVDIRMPGKWVIVIHDDDVTPMDFVIALLMEVFHYESEDAKALMLKVHNEGKGIVGTYQKEIADQKLSEAHAVINLNGMKLRVTAEEE